ncbi:MAG: hypothetical protein JNM27_21195 [Leptospirales bacterium]|nr:hypothetical protein [Leptospirales bacterium]
MNAFISSGRNSAALALLTVFGLTPLSARNEDPQIAGVRRLYQETNQKLVEMRQAPSESSIYQVELTVNSGEAQYPAVGTYKEITRFYYTFGDREKNPYPDRLLKIEVKTIRAARTESAEYLFDTSGALVFCFSKDETELRYYFARGKILHVLRNEATLDLTNASTRQMVQSAQERARRLVDIFKNSLH